MKKTAFRSIITMLVLLPVVLALSCHQQPVSVPAPEPSPSPSPVEDNTPQTEKTDFNLEGQVLYRCNRQPANGYYVYIFPESEGISYAVGACEVDANGVYHAFLKEGTYQLVADEDMDAKGFSYSHSKVEIHSGATTTAEDILVKFCPDLKLVAPANGANVTTSRPTFTWEPYSGAASYQVYVQAESGTLYRFPPSLQLTGETTITADEDLPSGHYEWYVAAYETDSIFDDLGESPVIGALP